MTSTSTLPWVNSPWAELAWPVAAACLTIAGWLSFITTERGLVLELSINLLFVASLLVAWQYHHRLLLALLSSILVIHLSFLALFTWPIPNLLVFGLLLVALTILWRATLSEHLHRFDLIMLLLTTTLAWLSTAYLPTNLLNVTTLTALPLFILLPPVYHRHFLPTWLFVGFAVSLAAAAAIIQTTVLFS